MFRFPWSNFHELNLDWILEVVKEAKEIFVNGRSDIDNAVETANEALEVAEQAAAAVIADGAITIPKLNNEVLKTTAYVVVGNRADEAVPAGAYVYLKNSLVSGLVDGIYTAAANIPAGAIVTPAEFQQSTELHDSGALNVLKNTLTQLDQNMAYAESGNTASRTYTAGDFISWKGTLYKASTAIPASTAFAIGVNLSAIVDGNNVLCGGLNTLNNNLNTINRKIANIIQGVNLGSVTLNAGGKDAIEVTGVTALNAIIMPYIEGYSYATTPNIQMNVIYSSNKWYIGIANDTSTNMTVTLKCKYIINS